MKRWKENLDGIYGLHYIHFTNVPMYDSEFGAVIDLPPDLMEKLAAKAIIENRIPLRGIEVQFLRKVIAHSIEKFANKLGLTSGSVFHWEKAKDQRLALVNEVAVRSFVAEQLGIEISGKFSELVGEKMRDIEIKAS